MARARIHATGDKCGEKYETGSERGKTLRGWQARENIEQAASAGNFLTRAKHGKVLTSAKRRKTINGR